MSEHYIWQDGQVIPVDAMTWAEWFRVADRHVALTTFGDVDGHEVHVFTVFLGLDYTFSCDPHLAVLWETMVFGLPTWHPLGDYQERYSSREDAEGGHAELCSALAGMLNRPGETLPFADWHARHASP